MAIPNLDWATAMTLVTQGSPLKLKVIDTIVFEKDSFFSPLAWIHTNSKGEPNQRSIRHLKLEPIVHTFMESCYSEKPRIKDPKAFVILKDDTRIIVGILKLWKLRASFPRGLKGLQLMHCPGVKFERNYVVAEFWTDRQGEAQCKVFRSPLQNTSREIAEPNTELIMRVMEEGKQLLEKVAAEAGSRVDYLKITYLLDKENAGLWLCGLEGVLYKAPSVKTDQRILVNGRSVYSLNPRKVIIERKRPMTALTKPNKVLGRVESVGNTILSSRIKVHPISLADRPQSFKITTSILNKSKSQPENSVFLHSSTPSPRSGKDSGISSYADVSKSSQRNATLRDPRTLKLSLSLEDRGKACQGDFCDFNLNYDNSYNRQSRFLVDSRLIEVAKKARFSPLMNPASLCTEIVVNGRSLPSQFDQFMRSSFSDLFSTLQPGGRSLVCVSCFIVYSHVLSSVL